MLELHYPTINILGQSLSLNDTSSFPEYARYFFNLGITLAGFIAVVTIAFGGVYFLIDYARGKFKDEGKEWIKAGITGLLIVMCAYLIAFTINPNLVAFKLGNLPAIFLQNPLTNNLPPGATATTYKEIPIGSLTETLLTRTMDSCYSFDAAGNPVEINDGPTYLDHDRADCLLQLSDGAQKKTQAIATLSNEIVKLMQTCSCEGKCNDPCNKDEKGCENPPDETIQDDNLKCKNNKCSGAACEQPKNSESCCDKDTKNKIEHGPIEIKENGQCNVLEDTYSGLDEFRCPNPFKNAPYSSCENIASFVEKQEQFNEKQITVIDQKNWKKLNLTQQLTYFKEKIDVIKQSIKKDADKLNEAKVALRHCYLAIPYIDLLKTYQATDQKLKVILINKTFKDPATNSPVDASKYCKGFNYGNSSCFKKCNDMCPDTSSQAILAYSKCTDPETQEACIEDAYNLRPCANASDDNSPKTFGDCINFCQSDCSDICSKQYLENSTDYKLCQDKCKNNSKCVLDNAESCLFGAQGFNDCASQVTDQGNTAHCISNAYMCKNGSDEYAGYPDCVKPNSSKCPDGQYSSSFLYKSFFDNYPGCEKCPYPLDSLIKGGPACQKLYPETTKCPSSSYCPNCPCDKINENLKFCVPNESTKDNLGNEGAAFVSQKILAYEIISPQCNEYAFNDDPLTFYCEDNWWANPNKEGNNPTPIGAERICSEDGEVPVGQTVDGSENWAKNFINETDGYLKSIKNIFEDLKKINDKQQNQYCRCDSKFDKDNEDPKKAGQPICASNCNYNKPTQTTSTDPNTGEEITINVPAKCSLKPCSGSSCDQIIDYLSKVWNDYRQFKLDYIKFYTNMTQEPRSDIIKQLSYSRQATNSCSLVKSSYGKSARLLSCTRVEDEIISPIATGITKFNGITIDSYCYGQGLGDLFDVSLTDNWFCCQEYTKNPVQRTQPK